MTLKDFSGGLNLRPYQADITPLNGRLYVDIDHQRGSLIPLRQPEKLQDYNFPCTAIETEIEGLEIPKYTTNIYDKHRVDYEVFWRPLSQTGLFYNYPNPVKGGGHLVKYIFRPYNRDTGEKGVWSDEINVVLKNTNSGVKIGKMCVNKELIQQGFTKLELFKWIGDKSPNTTQENNSKRTFFRIATLYFDSKGEVEYWDSGIYSATGSNYTVDIETSELKEDSAFFSSNILNVEEIELTSGSGVGVDAHTAYKFMVAFRDGKGNYIVAPNYCTFENTSNQYRNDLILRFTLSKRYQNKNAVILGWFWNGWQKITEMNNEQWDMEHNPSEGAYHLYNLPQTDIKYLGGNKNYTLINNGYKGKFTPLSCATIYSASDKFKYSNIAQQFIPFSNSGSVLDFKQKVYKLDNNVNAIYIPDKNIWLSISLPKPPNMIDTYNDRPNSAVVEKYIVKYRFTYYNSLTGMESPVSEPYEIIAQKSEIEVLFKNNANITADRLRVYRLSKGLIDYTLALEIPLNVSHNGKDIVSYYDQDAIAGNTQLLGIADTNIPEGIKYVTASNTVMFGAKEDKLYYSKIAKPYATQADYYIDFDTDITGIGTINNGLVVFTENEVYIVVGNTPNNFAKYLVSKEVGCINNDTIQPFNNGLIFASYDGIYWTQGSSIKNISNELLGKLRLSNSIIKSAIVVDNQYHLALTTDDIFMSDYYEPLNEPIILVFDFRYSSMVRMIKQNVSYITQKHRDIVFSDEQKTGIYDLYPLYTDYKELIYTSGYITFGRYTEIKQFNDIYIAYEGNLHLKITLHTAKTKKVIYDKDLPTGQTIANINTRGFIEGYAVELEIKGTGKLHEIDFTPQGRKNGK